MITLVEQPAFQKILLLTLYDQLRDQLPPNLTSSENFLGKPSGNFRNPTTRATECGH